MSFLTSPPEINSLRMYSGAGSGPLRAAAAAWNGLAGELGSAAQSFSSITGGLAGQAWQGPSSAAMIAVAGRYTNVLTAASAHAQGAAASAQAVAGEFEAALSAVVHPALVDTNRNQLMQLVNSNLFGQNAPAIAAMEAEYEAMWAKDVAAMVGYHGGVSAAVAQLPTWQAALQGASNQLSGAVAAGPVGSALSSLTSAINSASVGGTFTGAEQNVGAAVGQIRSDIIGAINTPTEMLFGRPLIGTGVSGASGSAASTSATGATSTSTNATVPLTMVNKTEPVVYASVGDGASIPLLVDTGSTGLVVPFQDVGGFFGLLTQGLPSGFGVGGYSGGLDYLYATYNMPVNFGGGVATNPTPVDVELFAWPTTLQGLVTYGFSFPSYFAPDGVSGVLGIGPNAGGPGPSIATQSFANSSWDQGVLINERANQLVFGPAPTSYGSGVTLTGSPVTDLTVNVGGTTFDNVPSIVDSGGVEGTFPTSVLGNPATGTEITVDSASGQPLYSYTYEGGANAYYPTVISSGLMNTGYAPFSLFPTYINNSADTTTIYTGA
ncbi:PecA family PE domain-processing aspartic protease [Mycobacterium sp. Lab-001]|uniref:PecA family PE domain-processing aspartic protease n=1 Tax=Mycobacterium sp. Lab-001 TaxID=3410136 RepID=UPI003D182BAD